MTRIKTLLGLADAFLAGVWGLTIIDLFAIINIGGFKFIDDSVKTALALAGLFYLLVIKIPAELKMNKLKRREKKAEIEKTEMENADFKKNHN